MFITKEMYEVVSQYYKPKAFNPASFKLKNKDKNQEAVDLAINTVINNDKIKYKAPYAQKIADIQSQNYNETTAIKIHRTRLHEDKKALIQGMGKGAYMKKLGYNFDDKVVDTKKGIKLELKRKIEKEKSIDEKNRDTNDIRNKLYDI